MRKRKVPIEIAGYKNQRIWVRDSDRGIEGFRRFSVVNDDHPGEDFLLWEGDSTIDDCPF